jgi:ankyrin repeat protein
MILSEDPEVSPELPDYEGFTAIHLAAARGDELMVKAFCSRGYYSKLGMQTSLRETPLHLAAASKDNGALIRLLLQQGAHFISSLATYLASPGDQPYIWTAFHLIILDLGFSVRMVPRYSGTGRQQRSSQKPRAFTLTPCAW